MELVLLKEAVKSSQEKRSFETLPGNGAAFAGV
jgi:hypothetical protein